MASHSADNGAAAVPRRDRKLSGAPATSDKVARMGLQESKAYEAQLRSLLDAAVAEPAPHGVNTAEVERRMRLIQGALGEVQQRIEQLRAERDARERERFLNTQQRRAAAEEEAEKGRTVQDKHRRELVAEMRGAQAAYYRDRNERTDEKAERCREFQSRAIVDVVQRAEANETRRERNLAALEEERQRQVQELRARDAEQQQAIREAQARRAARAEEERQRREQAARVRAQEVEAKLAAIRESKRSRWASKKAATRAKSSVVFKNGQVMLETETRDHEKLLEELESKTKGQQARYAAERAEQMLYLQQRAQHRANREDRQQANLLRLINGRLQRGEKIVSSAKKKRDRAEQTKEAQSAQYEELGLELRKDLAVHRKRAEELQRRREEEALHKNYRRWNHRAARIIAELNEAMAGEEAAREEALAAAAPYARYGNRDQQSAGSRSPRRHSNLPSPSDFAV